MTTGPTGFEYLRTRELLTVIERLPRLDRMENSLYGSSIAMSQGSSLIVQQQDLFMLNNRDKQLYCEQESDLRTLNDWLKHDDDLEFGGFDKSHFTTNAKTPLAEDRTAASNQQYLRQPLITPNASHIRVQDFDSFEVTRTQHDQSPAKVASAHEQQHSNHSRLDKPKQLAHTHKIKQSFVENLQQFNMIESQQWDLIDESLPGEIREVKQHKLKWVFPKQQQGSYDNEELRVITKKRIFNRGISPQTKSSYHHINFEQINPHTTFETVADTSHYLKREVRGMPHQPQVRHITQRVIIEDKLIQPLLDELLISKQKETALSKLSLFEDTLVGTITHLSMLDRARWEQLRQEEAVARQQLSNFSEQLERSQKHLKYCHLSQYLNMQKAVENTLRLVAVPLNYWPLLLERQQQLETIVQNFVSANCIEKTIKSECSQRFLASNMELKRRIQQKQLQGAPLYPLTALVELKLEIARDSQQILQLLSLIPNAQKLEEGFRLRREEELAEVREKIRCGQYREKELDNVLDYLRRHQITL